MTFALVFPGQGSQSVGMMSAYGDETVVRRCFEEASEALGRDLWRLAAEGPAEAQSQTVNTQPLMLAAGVAVYRLWRQLGGPLPAVVAGHSLGEYAALVAAEAIGFQDAIPLVELRARAMQEAVPQGQGAMAAILGLEAEAVRLACQEGAQGEVVEAVNFNDPKQTVIAGHVAAVARAAEAAKARGAKRAVMLPVSAPFHCSLMRPAAQALAERLPQLALRAPAIPLLHNADVRAYDHADLVRDALVRQACSPVRWVETIQAMAERGVTRVYECGPGKVLAGLTKRIDPSLQGAGLADRASLEQAIAEVA